MLHRLVQVVKNLLRPARTVAALVSAASRDAVRPRSALMAENAFLRQQVLVLRRAAPRRPRLHREDRLLLVLLARLDRAWRHALLAQWARSCKKCHLAAGPPDRVTGQRCWWPRFLRLPSPRTSHCGSNVDDVGIEIRASQI